MSNEKLFSEFPPVSTQEWESVILKDLKGADYDKKLIWKTDEGFTVRPYYRAENLNDIDYLNSLPDEFPFTRGDKATHNAWEIVQEVTETDLTKANKIALESVIKGANVISFSVKNVNSYGDLSILLNGVDLEKTGVRFEHAAAYIPFVKFFMEYIIEKGYDKSKIHGGTDFDAITYALKNDRFYISKDNDMEEAVKLCQMTADLPDFRVITINGAALHNSGATLVQEIGYALGIANEYLVFGTNKGLKAEEIVSKMQMTLSVGSNYFMEIAKLRAARLLWATLIDQYPHECDCVYSIPVHSVASSWNKTIYDPYVNMLRSTTEGMAAAIGGADSIALKPFDTAYKQDDEFSRRISRNVQVILKEESYFDKVVDPAAGSYYIENLTDSIAEHAWKLFQHVEQNDGIIALIDRGEIKAEIEKSCQKRDMDIATRKYILLGTNQYPNTGETMLNKVEKVRSCDSAGLKSYRGAAAFEELRLATERYAKNHGRPKVFLLKTGNLTMRQARAGFVTNFFGCAGYEIVDNTGFKTVEEGVKAAFEAKADIIVMCSSDEEYGTLGIEAAKMIKAKNSHIPFVIAGNPAESIEALKKAGADDFISVKTNVLESLKGYNSRLMKK